MNLCGSGFSSVCRHVITGKIFSFSSLWTGICAIVIDVFVSYVSVYGWTLRAMVFFVILCNVCKLCL